MSRFSKASLIGLIALGTLAISAPAVSAMPYRGGGFRVGVRGGFYGGGWGWGWGPGWYGPGVYGWYGPGYYGYGPGGGKVKIVTPDKTAGVFVDGGYVGPIAKSKKFHLMPGAHDVELRDPSGRVVYHQHVQIIRGRTTEIDTGQAG
ncbi:MAG: hypothetical protein ABSC93_12870 [Bryobacteraceae bacterium]|jgi:hypothetical protein